jgi:hypothetical protein
VFVAKGTKLPAWETENGKMPVGVLQVPRKEGMLFTTDKAKADAYRRGKLSDERIGEILGMKQAKSAALAEAKATGEGPVVVQARDKQGAVVGEAVTSKAGAAAESERLAAHAPEGTVETHTPEAVLARREEELKAQTETKVAAKPTTVVTETSEPKKTARQVEKERMAAASGERRKGVVATVEAPETTPIAEREHAGRSFEQARKDAVDTLGAVGREVVRPLRSGDLPKVMAKLQDELQQVISAGNPAHMTEADVHAAVEHWGDKYSKGPIALTTTRRSEIAHLMLRKLRGEGLASEARRSAEIRGVHEAERERSSNEVLSPETKRAREAVGAEREGSDENQHRQQGVEAGASEAGAKRGKEAGDEHVASEVSDASDELVGGRSEGVQDYGDRAPKERSAQSNKARTLGDLLEEVKEGQTSPHEAAALYGVKEAGSEGRSRRFQDFNAYLDHMIEQAGGPAAGEQLQALAAAAREKGLTKQARSELTKKFNRLNDNVGPEAAEQLRDIKRRLQDPVGAAVDANEAAQQAKAVRADTGLSATAAKLVASLEQKQERSLWAMFAWERERGRTRETQDDQLARHGLTQDQYTAAMDASMGFKPKGSVPAEHLAALDKIWDEIHAGRDAETRAERAFLAKHGTTPEVVQSIYDRIAKLGEKNAPAVEDYLAKKYGGERLGDLADPRDAPARPPGISAEAWRTLRVFNDPRVNRAVRSKLLEIERGGETAGLHELLEAIRDDPVVRSELPQMRALATRLLRLAPDITVISSERAAMNRIGFDATKYQGTMAAGPGGRPQHIVLNADARTSHVTTLLHEAVHAAVFAHLEREAKTGGRDYKVMEAIRDELLRQVAANGELPPWVSQGRLAYTTESRYWMHELHTMLLTDPKTQLWAAGYKPSIEFQLRMAELGYGMKPKSLWQSFTDLVRRAVGAKPGEMSLLDHVMRPTQDILERGAQANHERFGFHDPAPNRKADTVVLGALKEYDRSIGDPVLREQAHAGIRATGGRLDGAKDWTARTFDTPGLTDSGRRALLAAVPLDAIHDRYKALFEVSGERALRIKTDANPLTSFRSAVEGIQHVTKQVLDKLSPRVNDLIERIRAEPRLGPLMNDAGLAEAHLGELREGTDNSHLKTPEQQGRTRSAAGALRRAAADRQADVPGRARPLRIDLRRRAPGQARRADQTGAAGRDPGAGQRGARHGA